MTPPSTDPEWGQNKGTGNEKGADAVTIRTTFVPVTASTSSDGTGGVRVTLAIGGSSRDPWQGTPDLSGKSLTGPALPPAPRPGSLYSNTWTALLSGPKKYLHFD